MSGFLAVEYVGNVAVLRIERPRANALSLTLLAELAGAVEALAADLPGAVVITGTDRFFSAGADVTEFGGTDRASKVTQTFASVLNAIAALPRATVAAIAGYALGGGLELALACDFRVVAEGARLGQPGDPSRHHPGWRRDPTPRSAHRSRTGQGPSAYRTECERR